MNQYDVDDDWLVQQRLKCAFRMRVHSILTHGMFVNDCIWELLTQ